MTNEEKYKLINDLADEYQRTAMEKDVALDELNRARDKYLALREKATNFYNEWLKMVTGNYQE